MKKSTVIGSAVIAAGVTYGTVITVRKRKEIKEIIKSDTKPLDKAKSLGRIYTGPAVVVGTGVVVIAAGKYKRRSDVKKDSLVKEAVNTIASDAATSVIMDAVKSKSKDNSEDPKDTKEQTTTTAVESSKRFVKAINDEMYEAVFGNETCFDKSTGRYFPSSKNKIEAAVNKITRDVNNGDYVLLNDLFYEIGLSETELGYGLGFDYEHPPIVEFDSKLDPNGVAVLTMSIKNLTVMSMEV